MIKFTLSLLFRERKGAVTRAVDVLIKVLVILIMDGGNKPLWLIRIDVDDLHILHHKFPISTISHLQIEEEKYAPSDAKMNS